MEFILEHINKFMDKRKDRSYWILLILLFVILIASILLYRNIHAGATGNDNEVIGTLTFKHKTIERKYDSDVIWETIDSGIIIRNKDTIRSGDFSDAVLTLKDNTKININENSMIYLDVSEGDINLNFAYGSMSLAKKGDGSSNSTVKIKSGESTLEIKNSELTLEKKGKEELSFQVNQGTAKLKQGNQEKELKENESAKLNKSEIEISEVNLSLQSPADGSIISEKTETIPISFSWSAKNSKNLRLELAYDSRFQNTYQSFKVENGSHTVSLSQGTYYWRISSEKEKIKKKVIREYSSFRKVVVYSVSSPVLLSPTKKQSFAYTSIPPIVPFSWKKLETAKNYNLEISKEQNFSTIVKSFTTNLTSLGVDSLEPGKYFARISITPIRDEFKVDPSKSVSFTIEKKIDLESPELISPINGQEINSMIQTKSAIYLQVKDYSELTKYNFQLSNTNSFSNLILDETAANNQLKISQKLELGTYYWRVTGITQDGKKTPYSETRKFAVVENQPIELISPKSGSVLNLKENPVSFRWKKVPIKATYLIEVSTLSNFSNILHSEKKEEPSDSVEFTKEGQYYWRVTAIAEDGSIISKSNSFSFKVEEPVELKAIFPVKNEKVDMSPLDSIVFKWEKNKKGTEYQFELYSEDKTLISKAKTRNSYYQFKDLRKLDEGNFVWTLQDLSDKGKSAKIRIPFKIYLSNKPTAPEVKTPKKFYVE